MITINSPITGHRLIKPRIIKVTTDNKKSAGFSWTLGAALFFILLTYIGYSNIAYTADLQANCEKLSNAAGTSTWYECPTTQYDQNDALDASIRMQ